MILKQAKMNISVTSDGKQKSTSKLVLLWEEVGLCIHKEVYGVTRGKFQYRVSHFASGKSILRHIKDREAAENAMQWVFDNIMEDWRFTLEEWNEYPVESKNIMKERIDALQNNILARELHG